MFSYFLLVRKTFTTTEWECNEETGGFDVKDFYEQTPGPGLVFVEGGRLTWVESKKMLCMME